jgi:NADH dehydrogenase
VFQPLLYQVATGILSVGDVAPSKRDILSRQRNVRVLLGDVTAVDLDAHTVTSQVRGRCQVTSYDSPDRGGRFSNRRTSGTTSSPTLRQA